VNLGQGGGDRSGTFEFEEVERGTYGNGVIIGREKGEVRWERAEKSAEGESMDESWGSRAGVTGED
jgi:hypothetical protein